MDGRNAAQLKLLETAQALEQLRLELGLRVAVEEELFEAAQALERVHVNPLYAALAEPQIAQLGQLGDLLREAARVQRPNRLVGEIDTVLHQPLSHQLFVQVGRHSLKFKQKSYLYPA